MAWVEHVRVRGNKSDTELRVSCHLRNGLAGAKNRKDPGNMRLILSLPRAVVEKLKVGGKASRVRLYWGTGEDIGRVRFKRADAKGPAVTSALLACYAAGDGPRRYVYVNATHLGIESEHRATTAEYDLTDEDCTVTLPSWVPRVEPSTAW